jgi:hypothetical protein
MRVLLPPGIREARPPPLTSSERRPFVVAWSWRFAPLLTVTAKLPDPGDAPAGLVSMRTVPPSMTNWLLRA